MKKTFLATVFTLSAFGASDIAAARDLATLVSDAVAKGADIHPLSLDPALAPDAATPRAIAPGDPFAAWIVPADSRLDGVMHAGARSVSPGADPSPLSYADRIGLFEPHEEWSLWATDAVVNLARARALDAALRRIQRNAKRAGAGAALKTERIWVKALTDGAATRFKASFDRAAPKTLRWTRLDDVARLTPRTPDAAINLSLGRAPALQLSPQVGALEASYARMQFQRAGGLDSISSDRDGPVDADGISIGMKLHVGLVPGGLSRANSAASAAVGARNAVKRKLSERIVSAYDARRAADAHAPILKHRIRRFERLLTGFKGGKDPAAAAEAARALWTETAAQINARHARIYAEATILAATGRLFDRLYTDDTPTGPAVTARR